MHCPREQNHADDAINMSLLLHRWKLACGDNARVFTVFSLKRDLRNIDRDFARLTSILKV